MPDDMKGFRFEGHDELIFNDDDAKIREAGFDLMNEIGYGDIGGSGDGGKSLGIGIGELQECAMGETKGIGIGELQECAMGEFYDIF